MLVDMNQFKISRLSDADRLPADQTALIIVDMINRFCDLDWWAKGSTGLKDAEGQHVRRAFFEKELAEIIPRIGVVLEVFRNSGGTVVHIETARHTTDGRDLVAYMHDRDYGLAGSKPMSVIEELAPIEGEIVIRKPASSSFTGTGLDFLLRNAGIKHVVLCGQFGDACVFYTLIQSREFGYRNAWVEDGVLYQSQGMKDIMPCLIGSRWADLVRADQLSGILGRHDSATG